MTQSQPKDWPFPFSHTEFDTICLLVERARKAEPNQSDQLAELDQHELHDAIMAVFAATGHLATELDEGKVTGDFKNPHEKGGKLENGFGKILRKISKAKDPVAASKEHVDLAPVISAKIRNRWSGKWKKEGRTSPPTLRILFWDKLSVQEQREFRKCLADLERSFIQQTKVGSPHRGDLDAICDLLAKHWCSQVGSSLHHEELPTTYESLFVKFCHAVVKPVIPSQTRGAISKRLKRSQNRAFR